MKVRRTPSRGEMVASRHASPAPLPHHFSGRGRGGASRRAHYLCVFFIAAMGMLILIVTHVRIVSGHTPRAREAVQLLQASIERQAVAAVHAVAAERKYLSSLATQAGAVLVREEMQHQQAAGAEMQSHQDYPDGDHSHWTNTSDDQAETPAEWDSTQEFWRDWPRWVGLAVRDPQDMLAAQENFTVLPSRATCGTKLRFQRSVNTLMEASEACDATPKCTSWIWSNRLKKALLCMGHGALKENRRKMDVVGLRLVGLRKGCEHYTEDAHLQDAMSGRVPTCMNTAGQCPVGLHRVDVYSQGHLPLPSNFVCDECPDGVCPVLKRKFRLTMDHTGAAFADALRSFKRTVEDTLTTADSLGAEFEAYNPSMFAHEARVFAVMRITDQMRCQGKSEGGNFVSDRKLYHSKSYSALCELSTTTLMPMQNTCSILPPQFPALVTEGDELEVRRDDTTFAGLEDMRGFSFQGKIYFTASQGAFIRYHATSSKNAKDLTYHSSKLVLIATTPAPAGSSRMWDMESLMIRVTPHHGTIKIKNLLKIVSADGERLFFVISLIPYKLCEMDTATGLCTMVPVDENIAERKDILGTAAEQWSLWRGSTGFELTPHGYLGLFHVVRYYELGRVYSQKWVLLSKNYPFYPLWASAPFRMPPTGIKRGARNQVEDIQFPMGMLVDAAHGTVAVSYGVQDCLSWVAEVPMPPADVLEAVADADNPNSIQWITPIKAAEEDKLAVQKVGQVAVLRWESQVRSSTGFATVTRALAHQALGDPTLRLMLRSIQEGGGSLEDGLDAVANRDVYASIVSTNLNRAVRPHVTVRYGWMPNFHRVESRGLLVMYLPWEFEVLPAIWVNAINTKLDEVWTTSSFCKKHFVRAGVVASKVAVIPHGVSPEDCAWDAADYTLQTVNITSDPTLKTFLVQRALTPAIDRPFVFLFNGGMLARKGVDVLVLAYLTAFHGQRGNVLLVIHSAYGDEGTQQFVEREVEKCAEDHDRPNIKYFKTELQGPEMKALYAVADVMVQPARSEGWGLTISEAMAYGVPVVLPGYGSWMDFASNKTAFLFHAYGVPCTGPPCSEDSTLVFSPDLTANENYMWGDFTQDNLGRMLRYVKDNPLEAKQRAKNARAHMCTNFTWAKAYQKMRDRIRSLTGV